MNEKAVNCRVVESGESVGLVNSHIADCPPYVPGRKPERSGSVKLNQNENAYPPSPRVLTALAGVTADELRLYPDAGCEPLKFALADAFGIATETIFCGNGSDEIISLVFRVFLQPGDRVALTDPTYALYPTAAALNRIGIVTVSVNDDFSVDADKLAQGGARVAVLVNPNAPAGTLTPLEAVESLVRRFPGLVVVDEAYIDFAGSGTSALPLVLRYPNVLVLRTFSKSYGLCGLRVGFAVGQPALIGALHTAKDSYNVGILGQKLAAAALGDPDYYADTVNRIVATRERFTVQARAIGCAVVSSSANYVLCTPPRTPAALLYERLLTSGIYVRYFPQPRVGDKLRVSIGTDHDMDALLERLAER